MSWQDTYVDTLTLSHAKSANITDYIYTDYILYIEREEGAGERREKESGFARSRVGTGVRGTDFPGAPT